MRIFDAASDSRRSRQSIALGDIASNRKTSSGSACRMRRVRRSLRARTHLKRPIGDGMDLTPLTEHPRTNPLDVVERIAAINDWSFERAGDDEITMLVAGKWSD